MTRSIEEFRTVRLVHAPTPLERLEGLSNDYGMSVFIKRDDCTGLASGGNKARKLEYVLSDALVAGADTIITTGGLQSNHCRQTAAACARLKLRCVVVLKDGEVARRQGRDQGGNRFLCGLLGAQLRVVAETDDTGQAIAQVAEAERKEGHRPYVVPLGASTSLGALGYVRCAMEISAQMRAAGEQPTHVVVAAGSGGTQAGLVVGFAMQGALDVKVVGVDIDANPTRTRQRVVDLVDQTAALVEADLGPQQDLVVRDGFAGAAYGEPTEAGNEAIHRLALHDGVLLDPVYTGKAMAALIASLEAGAFSAGDRIVFVHTGGLPILLAYHRDIRANP